MAEDFCMVNYPTCRLEMKAFYLLKTIEGDTRYTHENLLNFDDFNEFFFLHGSIKTTQATKLASTTVGKKQKHKPSIFRNSSNINDTQARRR